MFDDGGAELDEGYPYCPCEKANDEIKPEEGAHGIDIFHGHRFMCSDVCFSVTQSTSSRRTREGYDKDNVENDREQGKRRGDDEGSSIRQRSIKSKGNR